MHDFGTPKREHTQKQKDNRFKKGNKASAGRRRYDKQLIQIQEPIMAQIFKEAAGDSYAIQRLMLERGGDLKLDVKTTMELCGKVTPYEKARAKDDVKDIAPAFNIVENRVGVKAARKSTERLVNEKEI